MKKIFKVLLFTLVLMGPLYFLHGCITKPPNYFKTEEAYIDHMIISYKNEKGQRLNTPINIIRFSYNNHLYMRFINYKFNINNIIHDPDCPCKIKK